MTCSKRHALKVPSYVVGNVPPPGPPEFAHTCAPLPGCSQRHNRVCRGSPTCVLAMEAGSADDAARFFEEGPGPPQGSDDAVRQASSRHYRMRPYALTPAPSFGVS